MVNLKMLVQNARGCYPLQQTLATHIVFVRIVVLVVYQDIT